MTALIVTTVLVAGMFVAAWWERRAWLVREAEARRERLRAAVRAALGVFPKYRPADWPSYHSFGMALDVVSEAFAALAAPAREAAEAMRTLAVTFRGVTVDGRPITRDDVTAPDDMEVIIDGDRNVG